MTVKTAIGNLALQLLREPPVLQDLDNDATNAAMQLRACYEQLRDEVMGAHPWNFAIDRRALTADATAPAFGYAYRYTIPRGNPYWLRPHQLDPETYPSETRWEEEGDYIVTDEAAPLYMIGIRRVTDEAKWSPAFVTAFAHRLAMHVGAPLGASDAMIETVGRDYERMLANARSIDGQTGQPGPPDAGEFLDARQSG